METKSIGGWDLEKVYDDRMKTAEAVLTEKVLCVLRDGANQGFKPDIILLRVIEQAYGRTLDSSKFQYLLKYGMWGP